MTKQNADNAADAGNKRSFYLFGPNNLGGGKGHGLVFENRDALRIPPRLIVRPADGGFPHFGETPRIVYDPKRGKAPRDMEGPVSGYWFVSEPLKHLFEEVDPEGFAFCECDYLLPDGSLGPKHFLCEVVRKLDALDVNKSVLTVVEDKDFYTGEPRDFYAVTSKTKLFFNAYIVGDSHVFYQTKLSGNPVCDDVIFNACRRQKEIKGILFEKSDDL